MEDVDLAEYGDNEDFPLHLDGGQLAYRTHHVRGESQGATLMSRNHDKSTSALNQQSSART